MSIPPNNTPGRSQAITGRNITGSINAIAETNDIKQAYQAKTPATTTAATATTASSTATDIDTTAPSWAMDTINFTSSVLTQSLSHTAITSSACIIMVQAVTGGGSFSGNFAAMGIVGAAIKVGASPLTFTINGNRITLTPADDNVQIQVMYQYQA